MNEEPTIEWRAQTLRLSVFPSSEQVVEIKDWTVLTGSEIPEFQFNHLGVRRLGGPLFDGQLQIISARGRVDILLGPPPPPPAVSIEEVETYAVSRLFVGDAWKAFERFREMAIRWLNGVEFDVKRLGLGLVAVSLEKDRLEAHRLMKSLLKSVTMRLGPMQDVAFSVNWPVRSGLDENMLLNRMTTWSAIEFKAQMSAPVPGGLPESDATTIAQGLQISLDHSTPAAVSTPLPRGQLASIFGELCELAEHNLREGEITCQ